MRIAVEEVSAIGGIDPCLHTGASGRIELDDCVGTLRHQNVAATVLDRAGKLVGAER